MSRIGKKLIAVPKGVTVTVHERELEVKGPKGTLKTPIPNGISFKIEGETGLRQSIGAGLHYMTPVGPLRLEYARPVELRTIHYQVTATQNPDGSVCDPSPCILLRDATVKETGRIFLSIGYPF